MTTLSDLIGADTQPGRPTIDHIDRATRRLDDIPNPPPYMWAKWRRIVLDQAPDLADMLGVEK